MTDSKCRVHVLRRFSWLEWAIVATGITATADYYNTGRYSWQYALAVVLAVLLSGGLNKEKNYQGNCTLESIEKLAKRRFEDVIKYLLFVLVKLALNFIGIIIATAAIALPTLFIYRIFKLDEILGYFAGAGGLVYFLVIAVIFIAIVLFLFLLFSGVVYLAAKNAPAKTIFLYMVDKIENVIRKIKTAANSYLNLIEFFENSIEKLHCLNK